MKFSDAPHVREECTLHRYNKRKRTDECSALKECYCKYERECTFYRTTPVDPPDPLYAGPAITKKAPTRIPNDVIARAVRMKQRGLTWTQIGKELGHEPRVLQNRVCQDRKKGKVY